MSLIQKPTDKELERIATQLGCPNGSHGVLVGQEMEVSNKRMIQTALNKIKLQNHDIILELGHGNGAHIPKIIESHPTIKYHGLEVSDTMIEEAGIKSENYLNNAVTFQKYDGTHIPFEDEKFDKILTVNTIYFWQRPEKLIQELYRVLKQGGFLGICFAQKKFMEQLPFTQFGFQLYDTPKIVRLMNNSPFKSIDISTYSENVKSKLGDMVNRQYTMALIEK